MTDRPTLDQRRRLADRLIAAGADPAEARRTAGVPAEDPDPTGGQPTSGGAGGRRSPRKRARRRRRRMVKVPATSSIGGLVAQSLGLVALYWFVKNAGSAAGLIRGIRRVFDWWVSPSPLPF